MTTFSPHDDPGPLAVNPYAPPRSVLTEAEPPDLSELAEAEAFRETLHRPRGVDQLARPAPLLRRLRVLHRLVRRPL